ncbi:nucleotidyltransferase domain-containing protein [Paenibacillus tarimensis]
MGSPKENDLFVATEVSEKIKIALGDQLQKVVLFGSRARGDSESSSDFDFLIIANFEDQSWPKRSLKIRKAVGYFGESVDYLPVTEEEFKNKILIRKTIEEEGVVLYERRHPSLGIESQDRR